MKLGKKPARPGAVKLAFAKYANLSVLPTPPAVFGHGALVKTAFNMLGNDNYGDCYWAGAAHETLVWNYEAGKAVPFGDTVVLSDYAAATGFNQADPNTDQGTDMQAGASYRQKTGILDKNGQRHKIGAYLALKPGDVVQHLTAAYLFGTVGVGVQFPNSGMTEFNGGQPWAQTGGSIDGGHYIPLLGTDGGLLTFVSWGREQMAMPAWFEAFNDESIVYVSSEFLTGGKSLEGFDLSQLQNDLKALGAL